MKKVYLFSSMLLLLISASLQAQINCLNYPNRVATVSGYPAPRCTLLTPILCTAAAIAHVDSVPFREGHVSAPVCTEFGSNPLNNGRMALCFGRNVPLVSTSSFLANPTGEVFVVEIDLGKNPNKLYVWTYANGTKTYLDSTVAALDGNIINGYQRLLEFDYIGASAYPGDPNLNRVRILMDGVVRLNFIYDIPNQLWGGKAKAKMWVSSRAGTAIFNTQIATLMALQCSTHFILINKQAGGQDDAINPSEELQLDVYPNPVSQGRFSLAANQSGTYRLVSNLGILLSEGDLPAGTSQIPIEDIAKGIYMVEFRSGAKLICKRLVVQ